MGYCEACGGRHSSHTEANGERRFDQVQWRCFRKRGDEGCKDANKKRGLRHAQLRRFWDGDCEI